MSPSRRLLSCRKLLLLVPLLAAGCGAGEEVADACAKPEYTLIFYDQSASSQLNERTRALFADSIESITERSLSCPGDQLHAFLVHGKTRSNAHHAYVVNELSQPDTLKVAAARRVSEMVRYEGGLEKLRDLAHARLVALFDSTNIEPAFARNTDLLGTLEVASGTLPDPGAARSVRIYYLSDMNESMRGGGGWSPSQRDFDREPPQSRQMAEAWADADTVSFGHMALDRDRLANAEVRVLQGDLATKARASEVGFYWKRLFQHAGVDPDNVRFN